MHKILAGLVLMAACSDTAHPDDPGPDAGSPMGGAWHAAWECKSGCDTTAPDPAGTTALDVAGNVLTYSGNGRSAVHTGATEDGACLNVPAQDEAHRHRNAYSLCMTATGAGATIAWSYVNVPTAWSTWTIRATR